MNRTILTAAALSAMLAFGCDDKKEASSPEVQKAADKTADAAADKMGDVKSAMKDATADTKDQADKAAEATKSQANTMAADTKNMADSNQSAIDTLVGKAKDAIKDKKWSDADNYVSQIESLKAKLPAEQQPKVDAALGEVKKLISAGKTMMPGK